MKINSSPKIFYSLFFIILLTGSILRFYNIDKKSYWLDEELSIRLSSLSISGIIDNSANETHPPLYYFILHYWMNLFGDSEASARSLSAIFGIISIMLIYQIGKLIFGREAGLISSLILAISAFHINYSQEARMYSLMSTLTLLSMYFFIKIINKNDYKFSTYIYYSVSSALLIYSHIYGLFIIMAQNVYAISLMIFSRKDVKTNFKKWLSAQLFLFLTFIPWIFVLMKQLAGIKAGVFVNISWLVATSIKELFLTFLLYSYYNPATLTLFLFLSIISFIVSKKFRLSHSRYLLVLWLLVPILTPYLISKFILPIYSPKYTISASLPFYLLASKGIIQLKKQYKIIVLLAIIFLSLSSIAVYYLQNENEPWNDAAGYIDKNSAENDYVLVLPSFAKYSFERYSRKESLMVIEDDGIIPSSASEFWVVVRGKETPHFSKKYNLLPITKFGDIYIYKMTTIKYSS